MIEQRARTSAEELQTRTVGDVAAGLADLHDRQARHRRRTGLLAAASVVLAAGLGAGIGTIVTRAHDDRGQTPTHGVTRTTNAHLDDPACILEGVECLGDRTYQFSLNRTVRWALPPGFGAASGVGVTSLSVESYRAAPPAAGVTVLEQVSASQPDGTGPAPGIGQSPRAFVEWLAARPYLDAGRVARTTIDGRPAWRVRLALARDAGAGDSTCSGGFQCHAITYQRDNGPTGIWGNMSAQYIALRLPGVGTTVVWSWVFSGDRRHLGALEEAVHGISWPAD